MTGIVELEPNLPAGRVRLNVRTPEGRVIGFRPDPKIRPSNQPSEQYETEWYAHWTQQVGKTITFQLSRSNAVVEPQAS